MYQQSIKEREVINELKLPLEEQFIINCLRLEYGGTSNRELPKFDASTIDWNLVFEKSLKLWIAPLLNRIIQTRLQHLQILDIPDYFFQKMNTRYIEIYNRNKDNFEKLVDMLDAFNKAGIKVILLKGAHLAQFIYKDIGLRAMNDVDILIKREDLNKSLELLFQMGYDYIKNLEERERQPRFKDLHHLFHPKGVKALEIHWAITNPFDQFNIDIEGLRKRAKEISIKEQKVLIFSPEDLLLHLSLHISFNHKLRYRLLGVCIDIVQTIRHYDNKIDWDQLHFRACEWGVEKYLYLMLYLSHELIGVNLPDIILHTLDSKLFNEKIILEAKKRIFLQKTNQQSIQPHDFGNNFSEKLLFILHRIFVSSEELKYKYSLPASSKCVYFYYLINFISMSYRYLLRCPSFLLDLLFHKKERLYQNYLNLWLSRPNSNNKNKI